MGKLESLKKFIGNIKKKIKAKAKGNTKNNTLTVEGKTFKNYKELIKYVTEDYPKKLEKQAENYCKDVSEKFYKEMDKMKKKLTPGQIKNFEKEFPSDDIGSACVELEGPKKFINMTIRFVTSQIKSPKKSEEEDFKKLVSDKEFLEACVNENLEKLKDSTKGKRKSFSDSKTIMCISILPAMKNLFSEENKKKYETGLNKIKDKMEKWLKEHEIE